MRIWQSGLEGGTLDIFSHKRGPVELSSTIRRTGNYSLKFSGNENILVFL